MSISVSIIASDNVSTSSVRASGSVIHIITDEERNLFGIGDDAIKNAVNANFGRRPNDVFMHDPTDWSNQTYARYGWPQTQTILEVINAQVLSLDLQPTAMASSSYENNLSVPATFNANLTDSVTETVESNWSNTYGFEVSQTISYGVEFAGANVGGETSMSFNSTFGQGGSQSKQVTLSTSTGVSFELQPGQKAKADMSGSRGTLKVRLTYRVYLTGGLFVNYNPTYNGHHFYYLDINSVMNSGNIQTSYQITEDIEIGYYADAKIVVTNL